MVIACSSIKVFPLPRSPTSTRRMVSPEPFGPICCMALPRSNVSRLTSIAGLLNNGHPCVTLNASTALNWSTTDPGIPRTCPRNLSSTIDSALISCKPFTSKALVLLSTILLRRALRSPMAGLLLRSTFSRFFFFFLVNVRFTPRSFLTVLTTPAFFFGGRASRGALVIKGAVREGRKIHGCCTGRRERRAASEALERHRQQVWKLIVI